MFCEKILKKILNFKFKKTKALTVKLCLALKLTNDQHYFILNTHHVKALAEISFIEQKIKNKIWEI